MEHTKQQSMHLRQEAESRLDRRVPSFVKPQPGENLLHELMHELRVSQIELELQNDALLQTQIELEKSRDHYVEFYDFALVGYVTLSSEAMIEDLNLPGATLLGVERKKLMHRRFATFIAPADQDRWNQLFISAMKNDEKRQCELALQKSDGTFTRVMLICQRLQQADAEMVLRIVLVDIAKDST